MMNAGARKLLLHACVVTAIAVLILSGVRATAVDGGLVKQLGNGNHLSAVDPVGNYLIKRRQPVHEYDKWSDDKRRAPDPVGSYLLRRRGVDPVGSYLLKKSLD